MNNPLIRRFLSGSLFAGAFVWVAVRYFNVDPEVVWVLLVFSVLFVLGLIVVGFLLAPVIRLFRGKPALLSKIEAEEAARVTDADDAPPGVSRPRADE